jgi:hypothetical protein
MSEKNLRFKTNYNNKMDCNWIPHLGLAPKNGVPESTMKATVFVIDTEDNSHPPIRAQLNDLVRIPLEKLPESFVNISHAMEMKEYLDQLFKDNPGITPQTELAMYYYKKIEA